MRNGDTLTGLVLGSPVPARSRLFRLLVYAVVSTETGKAIELFVRREDAERMLAEVLADEPDWRDVLSVEEVEFSAGELSLS